MHETALTILGRAEPGGGFRHVSSKASRRVKGSIGTLRDNVSSPLIETDAASTCFGVEGHSETQVNTVYQLRKGKSNKTG